MNTPTSTLLLPPRRRGGELRKAATPVETLRPGEPSRRATPEEYRALVAAYLDLLQARWYALHRQEWPSTNPVPRARLRAQGVGDELLSWLHYQGHVEHLEMIVGPAAWQADVGRRDHVAPVGESCYALTELGQAFAAGLVAGAFAAGEPGHGAAAEVLLGRLVPRYDREGRTFSWGRHVLKRFRQQSGNQEIVLRAAEELGWPPWFDDPLPPKGGHNPKLRLHNTVNDLNRRQTPCLIHFKADGTGTRLGWEYR